MGDLINRQDAIDAMYKIVEQDLDSSVFEDDLAENPHIDVIVDELENLPSAEPEIIYCKDCKHWTQTTGKMKGYGLGKCDFHDADLVTCNAYCYWAERRSDE